LLAVRPLPWHEIIDLDDDTANWADPGAPSGGRAVLALDMTMKIARVRKIHREVRKGPGKGREQRTERGNGRGRGMETVKGKALLNKRQREMISLVASRCSCRRNGMRQTRARRATYSGYIYSQKHRPQCQFPLMMIPPLPASQTANRTQNVTPMWTHRMVTMMCRKIKRRKM